MSEQWVMAAMCFGFGWCSHLAWCDYRGFRRAAGPPPPPRGVRVVVEPIGDDDAPTPFAIKPPPIPPTVPVTGAAHPLGFRTRRTD